MAIAIIRWLDSNKKKSTFPFKGCCYCALDIQLLNLSLASAPNVAMGGKRQNCTSIGMGGWSFDRGRSPTCLLDGQRRQAETPAQAAGLGLEASCCSWV